MDNLKKIVGINGHVTPLRGSAAYGIPVIFSKGEPAISTETAEAFARMARRKITSTTPVADLVQALTAEGFHEIAGCVRTLKDVVVSITSPTPVGVAGPN